MAEPYLGTIQTFGFNFAPRGWQHTNGQLLPISSNSALFSLLGTTFGGDGRTTFALPELRSRVPVHVGTGPGLDAITWGQRGGTTSVTLNANNLPSHSHPLMGVNDLGDQRTPGGNALAGDASGDATYKAAAPAVALHAGSVGNTGGSVPFNSRNPFLGIYYNIAMIGVFPSRS